jgi:hypothetical protein
VCCVACLSGENARGLHEKRTSLALIRDGGISFRALHETRFAGLSVY